jgi:uncharacterized protein YjbI with pentapeptide repeats
VLIHIEVTVFCDRVAIDLSGFDFRNADMGESPLISAYLLEAYLGGVDLKRTDL